jgi:hypothetical protein
MPYPTIPATTAFWSPSAAHHSQSTSQAPAQPLHHSLDGWHGHTSPIIVRREITGDFPQLTIAPQWLAHHSRSLSFTEEMFMLTVMDALTVAVPILETSTHEWGGRFALSMDGSCTKCFVEYMWNAHTREINAINAYETGRGTTLHLGESPPLSVFR